MGKTSQLPISPQETQIQAPSFWERIQSQKKKIFIGLGSLLGVLILAGVVFGVYKYAQRQVQPASQPTPTPVAVATTTPDETANWETYTNKKCSYEIKYPSGWRLIPESEDALYGAAVIFPYEVDSGVKLPDDWLKIQIGCADKEIEADPQGIVDELNKRDSGYGVPKIEKQEKITLNGHLAFRQIVIPSLGDSVLEYYVFLKGNKYYSIGFTPAVTKMGETRDLILSTFNFLKEGDKKTYSFNTGKDVGYELSYPDGWNLEVVYCAKEQCGEEANKYIQVVKISKDGYVFHLYSPAGFGMDFCFYPESTPYPPFYEGEEGHDFGTFKDYEKIESQYGSYIRGKTSVLGELDGKEKYYLGVCNKEKPEEHILEGVFAKYFLPSASYTEEKVVVMDDILKSLHKPD